MRKREALRLHSRDQVKVRTSSGVWESGYVYSVKEINGRVTLEVQADVSGYLTVDYTDVR